MKRVWVRTDQRRALPFLGLLAGATGCAPTVDVLGVYFPGWLVSAAVGVAVSYGIVLWLGGRPNSSALADSGVFFLSLVVGVALLCWWLLFSGVLGGT